MTFSILIYLALMLFSGLFLGRAVKQMKLPNVTGYLIAGLLIGPYCLKLIPLDTVIEFELISEIALAFIAFTIGAEFKLSYLKKVGITPVIIAVFEALTATLLITVILLLWGFEIQLALLLGAIASATAPAATIMVIKQYKARGPVTETLLSVVALDDAIALITFGISIATVNILRNPNQGSMVMSIFLPIIEIIGSIGLGLILGMLFTIPLRFFKKDSNRLVITVGFIFLGSALATMLGLSPLLLCMCMGATLVNVSSSAPSIFKLVDSVSAPIFLMFFVVSGAELDITFIPQIGVIGIIYVIVRAVGKILGASIGATVAKAPLMVKKYIGFTLIPQAGVAIGLSLIAAKAIPEYGKTIRAVVLCATLIYELVGPAITKIALKNAGEISE